MSCNCQSPYAKSCIRVSNTTAQTVTASQSTLILEGTPVVESGCSLTLNPSSITVNKSGLYHLSADITFTPTAAGIFVFQLYRDGSPLPCAIITDTVEEGNIFSGHIETDLCINTCCVSKPQFTVVVSGAAGTVNNLCVGALKLA